MPSTWSSALTRSNKRCYGGISGKTSCEGNGAIGAEIVAPVLHFKEITRSVATAATGGKALDIFGVHREMTVQGCAALPVGPSIVKILYEVGFFVAA